MTGAQRRAVRGAAILFGIAVSGGLGACGNLDGANLVFGQQHTLGVSISGSTTDQGGELTLGFKDKNIAVVPVAVKGTDGAIQIVYATTEEDWKDSFSVLGQFEADAKAGSPEVGLGKFFATGQAAQILAEGFRGKLCGNPCGHAPK